MEIREVDKYGYFSYLLLRTYTISIKRHKLVL